MKLIIASDNAHKLREIGEILSGFDVELQGKRDAGFLDEIEETGTTFAENARIKAEAVLKATGCAAMGEDSGLCVDALGGAPGVYSARYTGNHADSDEKRIAYLLQNLGDATDRRARFVTSVCCLFPNGESITTEQTCEGTIRYTPSGTNGFGYDPIFQPDGYDCTMAELTPEQKNAISHRGKALREFRKKWEIYEHDHN